MILNPTLSLFLPLLFSLFLLSHRTYGQGEFTLSGVVSDSATGEPLVAATIRILGTTRGTITNADGAYTLRLAGGEYEIVASFLAYQPETLRVGLAEDRGVDFTLRPSPVQLHEVIVLAEDPAVEIIRKAIANKRRWMEKLRSYRFEAFTRQVLRRDTAIASITESYSTGYQQGNDTLREIIRQRRQTRNIDESENVAAVNRIVNFNEDEIRLFTMRINDETADYRFIGPTAPDALGNYEYTLLRTQVVSDVEVYTIRMQPRSRTKPLFDGTIMIADGTFAVVGVDVKPNETFGIPFLRDIDLRYRQQFALYDSLFWMPADVRIDGGFSINFVGFSLPRIGVEVASAIYEYAINVPIPDTILRKPRLTVDSSRIAYDSTFWRGNEVLPLTVEQRVAYTSIDSTQTLEKQFEPKGPLSGLGGKAVEGSLGHLDARFNRVEGFYLGGKHEDTLVAPFVYDAAAGYGISDEAFKFRVGVRVPTGRTQMFGGGVEVSRRLAPTPDGGYYGPLAISLMALIDENDYRDYFLATGGRAYLALRPGERLYGELGVLVEEHRSVGVNSTYSLFDRSADYRGNPLVAEGRLRAATLDVRIGEEEVPLDLVSRNALELSIEHSSPSLAASDFDYTRMSGTLNWALPTFGRRLLFPAVLRTRLTAGTARGTLPPQRVFTLDSRSSGYAPFGVLRGAEVKEFAASRFVMLVMEHNFRSLPFLALDIPALYRNNIELLLHGAVARTWGTAALPAMSSWYGEAGIGISRIAELLRLDVTYRFTPPANVFLTLGVANLF